MEAGGIEHVVIIMALFGQPQLTPAQQLVAEQRQLADQTFDQLVNNFMRMAGEVWNHPSLTPQQVLDACADLPDGTADRDLTGDLETARGLVGTLARFVDLQLPDSSWENTVQP